jgi:Family of unknown function (DUF6062)
VCRLKWSKTKNIDNAQPERRALWFTRSTLRKAFAPDGCAICTAVHASERKGIHSFLYEGMMSPSVRQKFLDSGGFCSRHFWMAKEIEGEIWLRGSIALAVLCEDLTRQAGSGLANVASVEPNFRATLFRHREVKRFVPGHSCMFCQDNVDKETFLAEVLEELVGEPEFAKPLERNGLCIRHGQLSLHVWKDQAKRDELFAQLEAQVSELSADLREFIRKYDSQYHDESRGREQDSVPRAMRLFVGPDPCRAKAKKERS